MKKLLLILLFPILAQGLLAQNIDWGGIGYRDDFASVLVNPAGLAAGNGGGSYLIGEYDPYSLTYTLFSGFSSLKLISNLGLVSWVLDRAPGQSYSRYVLSIPVQKNLFIAGDLQHNLSSYELTDWGLSAMYRPFAGLSMGANLRNLFSDNTEYQLGLALRPLAFIQSLEHRLTLWADTALQWNTEFTSRWKVGAEVDLDLFQLAGRYDFTGKRFDLELKFSPGVIRFGATAGTLDFAQVESRGLWYWGIADKYAHTLDLAPQSVQYELPGPLSESIQTGFIFPWDTRTVSLLEVLDELKKLEENDSVQAIVFQGKNFEVGLGQWEDLRQGLMRLKAAGKKLIFYYQNYNTPTYLLAAATGDEVFMGTMGSLGLAAPSNTGIFLKGLLDEWGIKFENFRSHPGKSAANSYTETQMTPEERANKTRYIQSLAQQWMTALEGRGDKLKQSPEEVFDLGPWLDADAALAAGLVDQLLYPDQFDKWLKDNTAPINPIRSSRVAKIDTSWAPSLREKSVALIPVIGAIGIGGEGSVGGTVDPELVSKQIRQASENDHYAAILLRIDSPGGTVLGSDLIAREVLLAKEKKPVFVSMGNIAASGGYYIAAQATRIVSAPSTLTGSIGVVATSLNVKGLLEKLRITTETLKTGEGGDFGSLYRDITPQEKEKWVSLVRKYYDKFVQIVASGRGMTTEAVDEVAKGQIWTGADALEKGLVDELGGLEYTLSLIQKQIEAKSLSVDLFVGDPGMQGVMSNIRAQVLGEKLESFAQKIQQLESLSKSQVLYFYEEE